MVGGGKSSSGHHHEEGQQQSLLVDEEADLSRSSYTYSLTAGSASASVSAGIIIPEKESYE